MRYEVIIKLKTGEVRTYISNIASIKNLQLKYEDYEGMMISKLPERRQNTERVVKKYVPKNKSWSDINK